VLLGLPAVVASLSSARGQRLGDLAAGTIVVRERRSTGALSVEEFRPPSGYEDYTARLDVSAIGPREYATIRDTLRRLPALPDHATRWRVAGQVATPLASRVTPPPPSSASAETWLRCVAAAVQARRPRQAVPPGPGGADRRWSAPPPAAPVRRPDPAAGPSGAALDPARPVDGPPPPPGTATDPHDPGSEDAGPPPATPPGGFAPPG
jgi:hypothetical protein